MIAGNRTNIKYVKWVSHLHADCHPMYSRSLFSHNSHRKNFYVVYFDSSFLSFCHFIIFIVLLFLLWFCSISLLFSLFYCCPCQLFVLVIIKSVKLYVRIVVCIFAVLRQWESSCVWNVRVSRYWTCSARYSSLHRCHCYRYVLSVSHVWAVLCQVESIFTDIWF